MYEAVVALTQPYTFLIVVIGLALANLWRRRRETRRRLLLAAVPFGALALISVPALSYPAQGTLEWRYPPLARRPDDAGAIVVLAGYVYPPGPYRLHPTLNDSALERCLQAAELYHQGKPCPVLASGGRSDGRRKDPACAEVMGQFLETLGVSPADLILEDQSRSTYENAVESARQLARRRIRKIVLVTDATHMLRAARSFRKQGLEVVPAACRHHAAGFPRFPRNYLPDPAGASDFLTVVREWLGITWYWLHGRI